ncbi:hypothetical protein OSTOST_24586, partial [Ostertagia ostertagi]
MATVKYGTNMIEIAMQNTDIEEMKPLDPSSNPLFSEHVYLGKGVIRIEHVRILSTRIRIPRAPPIRDIRTTVRNMAAVDKNKEDEKSLLSSS